MVKTLQWIQIATITNSIPQMEVTYPGSSMPDNNNDGIIDNAYIIQGMTDITDTSTPFSSIYARDTVNSRTMMIWNAYYGPMNAIYGQIINDDGSSYIDTILISISSATTTGIYL